jgi:hypothetical protein
MLGKITTARMTTEGVLCEDCLAFDPQKQNSWEAKEGTKLTLEGNKLPLLIKVTVASSSPPAGDAIIVGQVYDLNAYDSLAGVTPYPINISPSSTLSLFYDPNEPPPNSEIFIAYYNAATGWTATGQPGIVAEVGKTRGIVTHFTPFAVLAKTAEPAPAKFKVSNLTVSPSQAQLNQEVTVSVNVANTGETSGNYSLQLMVDGTVRASKQVTAAAGTSQTVNFTMTGDSVGRHQVEVADLNGEFEVARQSQTNWWLIGGITIIILAILAIVGWRWLGAGKKAPVKVTTAPPNKHRNQK